MEQIRLKMLQAWNHCQFETERRFTIRTELQPGLKIKKLYLIDLLF